MTALLLVLLAACPSPPPATESPSPTPAPEPEATPTPPPSFANPAEAEDLDPADDVVSVRLVAAPADVPVDGEVEAGFAYNGQVPGPTIRARLGDSLRVELQNDLDTPTTIHWHGLDVPWAMDGAAWMLDPVPAGGTFEYTFELRQAGTFWYHPHFDTERQVDLGLYGVLIVEDPAEPAADEELVLVFDDWGESAATDDAAHGHGLALPDRWLVSGHVGAEADLPAGSVVRLRLLNASNIAYLDLAWPGLRQIASDQGLLPARVDADSILLAPGDRAEAELLIGTDTVDLAVLPWSAHGGAAAGDPVTALTLRPSGDGAAPAGLDWPWAEGTVSPDPSYTDLLYVFQGDDSTGRWMINGETFPDVTIEEVPLDSEVIITVRNVSSTQHPFHLHGHTFEVVSIDGVPPAHRTIEDTVNVPIRQDVRLRLLADNPGQWMAHCHLLPHAEGGMMTVLQVGED